MFLRFSVVPTSTSASLRLEDVVHHADTESASLVTLDPQPRPVVPRHADDRSEGAIAGQCVVKPLMCRQRRPQ
jgi:hypothetical protein